MAGRNLFADAPPQPKGRNLFAEDPPAPQAVGAGEGGLRAAFQGATFGAGDEIIAAAAAALHPLVKGADGSDFGQRYDAYLARERDKIKRFRETDPVKGYGAEIVGAIPTAMVPMGPLTRAAEAGPLTARLLANAGIGSVQGGIYGFNAAEGDIGDRAKEGATGAAVGGVVGGMAPVVADNATAVAKSIARSSALSGMKKHMPSAERLKRAARTAYGQADSSGVTLAPSHFNSAVTGLEADLMREGLDPTLHPKAVGILRRFRDMGESNQIDTLPTTMRRLTSEVAASTDPSERRLGARMVEFVDDYFKNLTEADVLAGNPYNIDRYMAEGRDMWRRGKRVEMMDKVFTDADLQASGVENGLRIQARSILKNDKLRRGLTSDEVAALTDIVKGTPVTNVLRKIGRLGPGAGQQHNMMLSLLGSMAGAGAGATAGGIVGAPIGAAVLPAVGYGAQRAAEALTARQSRLAQALMASGGHLGPVSVNPEIGRLTQLLLQRNAPYMAPVAQTIHQ